MSLSPKGFGLKARRRAVTVTEVSMKTFAAMMLLVVANLFAVPSASAQCSNSIKPSCGVYATCFAKYCPCNGSDEYFLTYGKKYCEKFLGLATFSAEGVKWRDKTLVCLQEAIVPRLDIS